MAKPQASEPYTRRNSLRLSGFDYAAKRLYFVTFVTLERRELFLEPNLAKATLDCLSELRTRMSFSVYSYCLMPDHFHGLFGLGDSGKTLGEICGAFKSLSTREYWRWHKGKLWQRQFFDHIIRNDTDMAETLQYIELNPARDGLLVWPYVEHMDV
jgi:REP element-mobilizing transposase RayT